MYISTLFLHSCHRKKEEDRREKEEEGRKEEIGKKRRDGENKRKQLTSMEQSLTITSAMVSAHLPALM